MTFLLIAVSMSAVQCLSIGIGGVTEEVNGWADDLFGLFGKTIADFRKENPEICYALLAALILLAIFLILKYFKYMVLFAAIALAIIAVAMLIDKNIGKK